MRSSTVVHMGFVGTDEPATVAGIVGRHTFAVVLNICYAVVLVLHGKTMAVPAREHC